MSPATGPLRFAGKYGGRAAIAANGGVPLFVQWVEDDVVVVDVLVHLFVLEVCEDVDAEQIQACINSEDGAGTTATTIGSTQTADHGVVLSANFVERFVFLASHSIVSDLPESGTGCRVVRSAAAW